ARDGGPRRGAHQVLRSFRISKSMQYGGRAPLRRRAAARRRRRLRRDSAGPRSRLAPGPPSLLSRGVEEVPKMSVSRTLRAMALALAVLVPATGCALQAPTRGERSVE